MIYKTKITFCWQNKFRIEFGSQCRIFRWYIDIMLCYIILDINILYYILCIIKTIAANPRRSIFEKCFKSCFDIVERKISTRAFDPAKNY